MGTKPVFLICICLLCSLQVNHWAVCEQAGFSGVCSSLWIYCVSSIVPVYLCYFFVRFFSFHPFSLYSFRLHNLLLCSLFLSKCVWELFLLQFKAEVEWWSFLTTVFSINKNGITILVYERISIEKHELSVPLIFNHGFIIHTRFNINQI